MRSRLIFVKHCKICRWSLAGKSHRAASKGTLQSSPSACSSTDIFITNSQGRANSVSVYRQHWHFNHWQLRTEWKITMEFVLMHHHRLRPFNMLCNCPVTPQESYKWICFCAVKETEKQISPAVTSLQVLTPSMGVMLLLFSSIWLQKMQDDKWGRRQARIFIQGWQAFLLLTCHTTFFDNYFYLHIKTLIQHTQYSLMSTESKGDRLKQPYPRA